MAFRVNLITIHFRVSCEKVESKRGSLFALFVIQDRGWIRRPVSMPKALDQDLRDRVIDAVLVEGMSRRGAAAPRAGGTQG